MEPFGGAQQQEQMPEKVGHLSLPRASKAYTGKGGNLSLSKPGNGSDILSRTRPKKRLRSK